MNRIPPEEDFKHKSANRALLLAAHGSRKNQTTLELFSLSERLYEKTNLQFKRVCAGFLEFGNPKINDVIEDFIKEGITEIIVFPFFIASGTHILVDIPNLIKKVQTKYPHIEFTITKHLGGCQGVEGLILDQISKEVNLD